MSAIAGIIGAILGRPKKEEEKNKLEFAKRERMQPQPVQGQMGQQQSTPIGQVTGQQMPPQQQPAMGQQQSGASFQNGMNKVSTIANILQSLKGASGGGGQNQPYQMQMRRR